jgi:hypothetical protein
MVVTLLQIKCRIQLALYPKSVAVGDFNNDSRMDIVVTNSKDNNVGVFLGYRNGTFTNQNTYSTGFNSQPYSDAVGDFDNDSSLDIIVTATM